MLEKTEVKAKVLELQTLANFAGHLPLAAAQRPSNIPPSPSPHYVVQYTNVVSPRVATQIDKTLEDFEKRVVGLDQFQP